MNTKKFRMIAAVVLAAAAVFFTVRVNQVTKTELINRKGQTFEKGVVTEILSDNIQEDGMRVGEQTVRVRMLTGAHRGEELETTSSAGFLFGAACTVGLRVIVMQSVAGESVITSVYSRDRENALYIFAGIYLLALCVIGGRKGIRGALALVFTVLAVIAWEIPLLYRGYPPLMVSVCICAVTTLVTMYLIDGISKKSVTAALGTVAGVVTAAFYAELFSFFTGVTGWNVSDIESLLVLWDTDGIQVGQLLFSGILISALGATMDVSMSIASSMQEICVQNPSIGRKELWKAGMRIGRDLMGTDSNTLILAFAGGSLSMLLLDYAYDLPWRQVINSNTIGIAVMQGLAGSFGVVMAVPMTATIFSFMHFIVPLDLRHKTNTERG